MQLRGSLKKYTKGGNELKNLVEDFLSQCEAKRVTENTLKSHKGALTRFFRNYNGEISDISAIKRQLKIYLSGMNDAYYNKQMSALQQFFRYCINKGIITENPAQEYKYRRPTIQIVDHSEEEVKKFIRTINKDTFSGLRDYVFCLTMIDTGIRPAEALRLQIDDIDFTRKRIHVRAEIAKTRQERYLPISVPVVHILQKIIGYRPDEWKKDIPVLCTYEGTEMPTKAMQKRFHEYAQTTGVNITPYHLRHIFAVNFIRNGGDAFALQKIMGHKTMNMTMVYVRLNLDDLSKKHDKATPLNQFLGNRRVKNIKRGDKMS